MDRAAIPAQTLSTSPATPPHRPATRPPPQPTACRHYPSRLCAATGSRPLQRQPRPRCCRWVLTDCAAHPEARCVAIQATHSVGTPVAPLGSPHLRPWRPREPPKKRARHSPRCALAWGGSPATEGVCVTLFCPPSATYSSAGRAALAVRRLPHRRRRAAERKRARQVIDEALPPCLG